MITIERLINKFERDHFGWTASWINTCFNVHKYEIYIVDPDGNGFLYNFDTCREFREWARGVVLD